MSFKQGSRQQSVVFQYERLQGPAYFKWGAIKVSLYSKTLGADYSRVLKKAGQVIFILSFLFQSFHNNS